MISLSRYKFKLTGIRQSKQDRQLNRFTFKFSFSGSKRTESANRLENYVMPSFNYFYEEETYETMNFEKLMSKFNCSFMTLVYVVTDNDN